jgi:hypothetical protein
LKHRLVNKLVEGCGLRADWLRRYPTVIHATPTNKDTHHHVRSGHDDDEGDRDHRYYYYLCIIIYCVAAAAVSTTTSPDENNNTPTFLFFETYSVPVLLLPLLQDSLLCAATKFITHKEAMMEREKREGEREDGLYAPSSTVRARVGGRLWVSLGEVRG